MVRVTRLAAFALLAASCGGSSTPTSATQPPAETTATPRVPTSQAPPEVVTTPAPPAQPTVTSRPGAATTQAPVSATDAPPVLGPFEIVTSDGLILEADRFGTGDNFVVLAHMRPADMSSWTSFAGLLAGEGYSVITFNFRGYGNSEGAGFSVDVDVVAAVDAARKLGAERVYVIGASMGGTGAIAAGAQRDLAAVITLSAPARFMATDALEASSQITTGMLLFAAENDSPYPADAASIEARAGGSTEVVILSGRSHGTDLFRDHSETLTQSILIHLATN